MKKVFGLVVVLILLCANVSYGEQSCISSGLKTADALILTGGGQLCGILVLTDETNDATLVVQDGLTATGTVVSKMIVEGSAWSGGVMYPITISVTTGLYADMTVALGAMAYIVYYRP